MERRNILKGLAVASLGLALSNSVSLAEPLSNDLSIIKPHRLKKGDTVGVAAPGTAVSDPDDIAKAAEILNYFGLKMKWGSTFSSKSGYKSKTTGERINELHELFEDDSIAAVMCIRGGYGSAQLLDKIDYSLIRKNAKIFTGYSDITALHAAFHRYAGIVTYHSPVLMSSFTGITTESFVKVLFDGTSPIELSNPKSKTAVRASYPTRTISGGKAEGILAGGNLSILSSLMGTPYELDTKNKILFIEDVGEDAYRIDRMLTQMRLAGKFKDSAAVVFGKCQDCVPQTPGNPVWDTSLGESADNIIGTAGVPAFSGLLIGHTSEQLTLPIGINALLDADNHKIELLENTVQ